MVSLGGGPRQTWVLLISGGMQLCFAQPTTLYMFVLHPRLYYV